MIEPKKNHHAQCVVEGCEKVKQHRSGRCRGCENARLIELGRLAPGPPRAQVCQQCGRQAQQPLCVACRTGQTEVGLRQKAEEAAAAARMAERAAPAGPLYTRKVGQREYDVMFDGSVR